MTTRRRASILRPTRIPQNNVRSASFAVVLAACGVLTPLACGSDPQGTPPDAGRISLGDGGFVDAPETDGQQLAVDGGFEGPDGSVLRADRFITEVVSFTPGECAGFGLLSMPGIVKGPPVGGSSDHGSLDVVSLGVKGEIVVAFTPNAIVDGPGVDFIVFENPFFAASDPSRPNAELGEVSVSEDGVTWKTFPCAPKNESPYGACGGWHPVYSAPGNGISPFDPATAGGDPFDLADVGLARARFVRIRDLYAGAGTIPCAMQPPKTNKAGFDLDAVAIVHAEIP